MNVKSFLTIDSGGSKTKLSLYDINDVLVKEFDVKGYGSIQDSDEVIVELVDALKTFCKGYTVSAVVCNLGGKNKIQLTNTIKTAFPNAKVKLFRESEGVIGVKLCEKFSAQVTLMAGTGSIAIAPAKEKIVISGGWGANISDKGSGYQLGLDAIRLALEEIDGTNDLSFLAKTLTGVIEAPKVMTAEDFCSFRDGVRQKLFPLDRAHIASFAKTVYACAKKGDKTAMDLYKKVGSDLADSVILAVAKTGEKLKGVVVTGGMVNAKEFWQDSFEEKLGNIKVYYVVNGIEVATRDMAKEMIKGE